VLLFFFNLYKKEDIERLEKKPMFWYCMGILIYSSPTYFLFAYYDHIKQGITDKYLYLWALHDVMNMLMYIIFTKGIVSNKSGNRNVYAPTIIHKA